MHCPRRYEVCAALIGVLLSACHRSEGPATTAAATSSSSSSAARVVVLRETPRVAEGVVTVVACEATEERCNALDDDCDRQIDESCGVESGALQILLGWDTGADIDLYVTGPNHETLSFQRPRGFLGGEMNAASRGSCEYAPGTPNIESIRWRQPRSGDYRVELHYWGECATGSGITDVSFSLVLGRQHIASYRYGMVPNERIEALRFSVDALSGTD